MAESRDEWCFDFLIGAADPIPYGLMDELLWENVVGWAEGQHLGIGGGFRPAPPREPRAVRHWHFRFGLCRTEDGQRIPASQASELEQLIRAWSDSRGFEFSGGFRAFTPAECDPAPPFDR